MDIPNNSYNILWIIVGSYPSPSSIRSWAAHTPVYERQPSKSQRKVARPESFPVERSPVRGNFPGPVPSSRDEEKKRSHMPRQKRRRDGRGEEKRGERRPVVVVASWLVIEPSREARSSEQESPERRSLAASPWLRSVPGYGQLFFTFAGERPLRFFVPRLNQVSFRRPLSTRRA